MSYGIAMAKSFGSDVLAEQARLLDLPLIPCTCLQEIQCGDPVVHYGTGACDEHLCNENHHLLVNANGSWQSGSTARRILSAVLAFGPQKARASSNELRKEDQ